MELITYKKRYSEYLDLQGIFPEKGSYYCINPEHNDSNPSAKLKTYEDGTQVLKCFSCNHSSDIFEGAKIVEGNSDFVSILRHLSEQLSLPMPSTSISSELILFKKALSDAFIYLKDTSKNRSSLLDEEIDLRRWDLESLPLGYVSSYDDYVTYMNGKGHTKHFLFNNGLYNSSIFNEESLFFLVYDKKGNPSSFYARCLNKEKLKNKEIAKFQTIKDLGFYSPKNSIFNLNNCNKSNGNFIYVFEGHPDVCSSIMSGNTNCVALGGTEVSTSFIREVTSFGFYDLYFCFDSDVPGKNASIKAMEKILIEFPEINSKFIFFENNKEEEKLDADILYRNGDYDKIYSYKKNDPFEYLISLILEKYPDDVTSFSYEAISLISPKVSPIKKEVYLNAISIASGFSYETLSLELESITKTKREETLRTKNDLLETFKRKVLETEKIEDIEKLVLNSAIKIEEVNRAANKDINTASYHVSKILSLKEKQELPDSSFVINSSSNITPLFNCMFGDLTNKWILLGASPNSGKTSLFVNIIHSILFNNDDTICISFTIDDSYSEFLPRFICYDSISRNGINSYIGKVSSINAYAMPSHFKDKEYYPDILKSRELSYSNLASLMSNGRLFIYDSSEGNSYEEITARISLIRHNNPNKKIFVFVDNFHLMSSSSMKEAGHEKVQTMSHNLKAFIVKEGITLFSTAEYRKLNGMKPTNDSLSGSGSLIYDSNAVIHMYSHLFESGEDESNYWIPAHNGDDIKYPIIENIFGKNKIGSFKGSIYSVLYPGQAYFDFLSEEQLKNNLQMTELLMEKT